MPARQNIRLRSVLIYVCRRAPCLATAGTIRQTCGNRRTAAICHDPNRSPRSGFRGGRNSSGAHGRTGTSVRKKRVKLYTMAISRFYTLQVLCTARPAARESLCRVIPSGRPTIAAHFLFASGRYATWHPMATLPVALFPPGAQHWAACAWALCSSCVLCVMVLAPSSSAPSRLSPPFITHRPGLCRGPRSMLGMEEGRFAPTQRCTSPLHAT